jgi:hypothetical protein
LLQSSLAGQSIPANDKDKSFLVAMTQIRRYMYGGLSKQQMKDYLSGRSKRIYFKGIMSFYPLVDDEEQLKSLDGWLVSIIYRALKRRSNLLISWRYNRSHIFPFNVARNDLLESCEQKIINGKKLLEIPSFLLIKKTLQKGLVESGIERIMNPDSLDYDY